MMRAAVAGPTPGNSSSCSAVALFRWIGAAFAAVAAEPLGAAAALAALTRARDVDQKAAARTARGGHKLDPRSSRLHDRLPRSEQLARSDENHQCQDADDDRLPARDLGKLHASILPHESSRDCAADVPKQALGFPNLH